MPVIAPEASVLNQTLHASLDSHGVLKASLATQSEGQAARSERQRHDVAPDQYKIQMERYLAYYAHNAAIEKIEAHDAFDQDQFSSTLEFESNGYGQLMQNRLLIFNPSITEPVARRFPAEKDRNLPIVLNGRLYRKQVSIKLPEGFTVDEMPSPFKAEAPFAKFKIAFRQEQGQLIVEEELRTEAVTLPASDYPKVKKFFDDVYGANNQNAVLVRN
jgi:hypothetical protein